MRLGCPRPTGISEEACGPVTRPLSAPFISWVSVALSDSHLEDVQGKVNGNSTS